MLDPNQNYSFGDTQGALDPSGSYSFGGTTRELYREAPQTGMETAVIIGLEVLPSILGGIYGGLPGGAAGSAAGNYLSQQYRIGRGLQDDVGLGELGAATVLGGVPVGKFANVGMAGKTAIRAGQGAGLATGELLARTYIDEDRAPTQEEIATTLLFGGVFGGTLGAVEAKFLKDNTGVDLKPGMTRPEVKDALASNIKDKGGVENASVGNPLVKEILETNDRIAKARQEYYNTPDPFAGSADEVAGNVLQGIENKLLKETEQAIGEIDNPVQGGILEQLKFDNQSRDNLRNAFNAKLASDNEIFTGVNPIVAKGNIADTRRLREIDEEIAKIDHRGKSTKQRKQLEKEKRALERKHNIVQNVLLGGAGVSAFAGLLSDEEKNDVSKAGMWAYGLLALAAAGGVRKKMFVHSKGKTTGPMDAQEIDRALDTNKFSQKDFVAPVGADKFTKIEDLPREAQALGNFNKRIQSDFGIGKPGVRAWDDEKLEVIIENIEDLPDGDKIMSLDEFDKPSSWSEETLNYVLQNTSITKKEFYKHAALDFKETKYRRGIDQNEISEDEWTSVLSEDEFIKATNKGIKLDTIVNKLTPEGIYESGGIKGKLKKDLLQAGISKKRIDEVSNKFKDFLENNYFDSASMAMGAATGVAASLGQEQKEGASLASAGGIAGGAAGGFFGKKLGRIFTKALGRGTKKGQAKNASDEAIRAKGGTPTPEPEPIGRAAVEAERKQVASSDRIPAKRIASVDDIKRYYSDELIEQLENTNDPNLQNIFAEELAERASRQTPRGRALRDKLLKISLSERNLDVGTFSILNKARNTPPGTQKINPNVRGLSQANKFELAQAARNGDEQAVEEIRKRAAKNPRTKKFFEKEGLITGLLTTGTGAIALMEMMDDDDDSVSRASLGGGELLIALALGTLGYKGAKKFTKSAEFKKAKAQIKANPSAAEPDIIKQARIDQTLERNPFASPSEFKEAMKSAQDFVRNALQPMSRTLKNINKALPAVFRKHEKEIAVRTREYMDKVSPFIVSMTKRLKDNPNKQRLFKQYLLNGEYTKISDEILTPNAPQVLFDQMGEMRRSLDDLRDYARQRGGLDVGYIEAYFPRKIKNYNHFRKALDEEEGLGEIRTELDKALDDYAAKNNISSRDAIPTDEAAEVVSRALRTPPSGGMTPGNVKMRSIESVSPKILDAYADPAEALGDYVQRMVQATERRNFLLRKPDASGSKVGFQGSQDTINADLGMRMEVSEDMVGALADRLRKENKLSQEDVDKLKEVIRARFNSKTVSPFFQGVKNANYIAVMGNFGSAITQLGDLAYSIHFNGFDNTFKTLFNRKDNFDFVKHFGLSDSSIDAATSSKGLSKVLDDVFTFTQLKRLDQLGKNTTMNASWKKFKAQAQKDAPGLADELAPVFGRERAGEMVKQLQQSNPASKNLPKAVEELIWYKFLDLSPATLGEMPLYYNTSGNMRIAYMLKSFTLKQFDVFREAGIEDIIKSKKLYSEGKKAEAAKLGSKGMKNLLGLAVVFAAANASTDVIKDMMYGRPIKKNDLLADNALKLLGINRYLAYKAKREGIGKAVLETMLPPMTLFDRGGKDLDDLLSGKEYKGNLLQGTPLDIVYWRYLGGLDKVKNMQ